MMVMDVCLGGGGGRGGGGGGGGGVGGEPSDILILVYFCHN